MEKHEINTNATLFCDTAREYIHRKGINELLEWLATCTDFFYAPCSTRYHLSEEGGLVQHSLNVFNHFVNITKEEYSDLCSNETATIITLFHDICKVNTYKPCKKSRKTGRLLPNGKPEWEDYTGYDFDEEFPYGHGEKSVYLLQKFITLTDEEAMAIRWHMGFSDSSFKGGMQTVSNAMSKYPIIAFLHSADLISTALGG